MEDLEVNWSCATCSSAQDVTADCSVEDHPPDLSQALLEDVTNEKDLGEKNSAVLTALLKIIHLIRHKH